MEINQIHKNVVLTVDPITNVVNIEVTQVISPPVILEVSEVGRKGDQGSKGDAGVQGIQGVKGDQGSKGDAGVQGIQGVKGDTGNDGLSAYQIAINNGTFVGTELEFATMLVSIDEKLDKGNYTGTAETLSYQSKIYENGQLQVFRKPGTPPDPTNPEPNPGDYCIGFVEGQFINAEYLGPDKTLLTSFNI